MTFSDRHVDVGGIDDRRGRGGGAVAIGGGGLGVVGLLIYLLVGALGGGDPSQLLPPGSQVQAGTGTGETTEQLSARCNSEGAIEQYDDCYLIKVYNEVNETWEAELARRGGEYRQPGLAFFEQGVTTGCGNASSQVGPFYCPPDQKIYIDIGFLKQLQREFQAEGRFAAAYIMAHEAGHHLQTLLGTERKMRLAQQQNPSERNELSIALELQADCYAGAWSKLSDERGNVSIGEEHLDQAVTAAAAVGDDRIQQKTQGRVDPE
ncbi:MAG: neutral zinc metallopeptidase, partial [Chloroflexota bacterium]|nr:neutral zinc metallopeptidase [Chloroflexota bacterium]